MTSLQMTTSYSIALARSRSLHTTPLSETYFSRSKNLGIESASTILFAPPALPGPFVYISPCHKTPEAIVPPANNGNTQLVVIHLVDSYNLTLPSMYISVLLLSLRAMLQMDLPHLNVLTKIDNLANYPSLPFNLDFYTEVQDLSYLIPHLETESPRLVNAKFDALNRAIVELVQDFGLVAFETLAVEDKKSMMNLLHVIDRASGYVFGSAEGANDTVWQVAVREGLGTIDIRDVQERWLDAKDEWDEKERRDLEEAVGTRETVAAKNNGGGDDDDMDIDELHPPTQADSGVKVMRKQ